jgi:hypothetical protein
MITFLGFVKVVEFGLSNKNVTQLNKFLNLLRFLVIQIWGTHSIWMTNTTILKRMMFNLDKQFEWFWEGVWSYSWYECRNNFQSSINNRKEWQWRRKIKMNKTIIYFTDKTLKETITWFCPKLCHNRKFIIVGNVKNHKWWGLHNPLCNLKKIDELNRVTNNNVQHQELRPCEDYNVIDFINTFTNSF